MRGGAGNSTKSDRQRMVEQARRSSMAAQKKKKRNRSELSGRAFVVR